jgi:hypothetical protein
MGEANAFAREHHLARLTLAPRSTMDSVWTADTSCENRCWLDAAYPGVPLRIVSKDHLLREAERRHGSALNSEASFGLAQRAPHLSARRVITSRQAIMILLLLILAIGLLLWRPDIVSSTIVEAASLVFVASTAFRAFLAFAGSGAKRLIHRDAADDRSLPLYTVLVPLYREARVVPRLVLALQALDYPRHLLDIKLIVEADDHETAEAAGRACSDALFEVVRVPVGTPRTKPRACNYALCFARGEFTVIFDAEDRPEPDQLRKAIAPRRPARGGLSSGSSELL